MIARRRYRNIFDVMDDMLADPFRFDRYFAIPAERIEDPVRVTVEHDADNYYVRAVVPGFADSELNVSIDGRVLTVSGNREATSEENGLHSSSRSSFSQNVQMLSDARLDEISAEHKDGILVVTVPRKVTPKIESRSIPIASTKQLEA